ncbi:MAG: DUF6794 domain-containing protein [Bacillota bacterium]
MYKALLTTVILGAFSLGLPVASQDGEEVQKEDIQKDVIEMIKIQYPLPEAAYWLSPTCDAESPTEVYIPRDLSDAFAELDRMLTKEFRDYYANSPMEDTIKYHFGLGMWLRNNWGLWTGERLAEFFAGIGIYHPDDMSGIILDSYWRYLNGSDICLQDQVEFYQEYWRSQQEYYENNP